MVRADRAILEIGTISASAVANPIGEVLSAFFGATMVGQ